MAIMATTTMSGGRGGKDDHENDLVMPGFRFHPTEEELIEFYLRRKVEGKRFNVELIIFLDLYRYDPWELPALAAIGEKEWYFYVPRDRKYRNGDRPNRVTTSGYWKATGADRVIRGEDSRSIGLKKTLVFYSGKAPKGIRTSWIMNEYRLPRQSGTDRHEKAEISLCRVYKRAGVEDNCRLPGTLRNRPSSSKQVPPSEMPRPLGGDSSPSSSSIEKMPCPGVVCGHNYKQIVYPQPTISMEDEGTSSVLHNSKNGYNLGSSPTTTTSVDIATVEELNRAVCYNQSQALLPLPPQVQLLHPPAGMMMPSSEKLWEWNLLPEYGRDYNGFK